jgi:phage regulator Rha-like protein
MGNTIPVEYIEKRIFCLRGEKVMIDRHLAEMYGVETRILNQAVKRNIKRFPREFMFQLSKEERDKVITICDHLHPLKFAKTMPFAFTEHGLAMLSSVLNSDRAIQVNIEIIKAFVRLRKLLATHRDLELKIEAMEEKYDEQFRVVFEAIKQLITEEEKPKRKIGF